MRKNIKVYGVEVVKGKMDFSVASLDFKKDIASFFRSVERYYTLQAEYKAAIAEHTSLFNTTVENKSSAIEEAGIQLTAEMTMLDILLAIKEVLSKEEYDRLEGHKDIVEFNQKKLRELKSPCPNCGDKLEQVHKQYQEYCKDPENSVIAKAYVTHLNKFFTDKGMELTNKGIDSLHTVFGMRKVTSKAFFDDTKILLKSISRREFEYKLYAWVYQGMVKCDAFGKILKDAKPLEELEKKEEPTTEEESAKKELTCSELRAKIKEVSPETKGLAKMNKGELLALAEKLGVAA